MNSRPSDPRRPRPAEGLLTLLHELADARTLNESRQLIEQHPELLGEEVDVLLDGFAAEARQQGNQPLLSEVEHIRAFLRRCRAAGVDTAFAEAMEAEEPGAGSLTSPFGRLVEAFQRPSTWPDARLAIHQHPELLDEEFDALLGNWIAAAREDGDDTAVALFEGQRDLLRRSRELGVGAAFIAIARESAFGFSPAERAPW
jgi:hypothetical protein